MYVRAGLFRTACRFDHDYVFEALNSWSSKNLAAAIWWVDEVYMQPMTLEFGLADEHDAAPPRLADQLARFIHTHPHTPLRATPQDRKTAPIDWTFRFLSLI